MKIELLLAGQLHRTPPRKIHVFSDEAELLQPKRLPRDREAQRTIIANLHMFDIREQIAEVSDYIELPRSPERTLQMHTARDGGVAGDRTLNVCLEEVVDIQMIEIEIESGCPVTSEDHRSTHGQFRILELRLSGETEFAPLGNAAEHKITYRLVIQGKIPQLQLGRHHRCVQGTRALGSEVHASFHVQAVVLQLGQAGEVKIASRHIKAVGLVGKNVVSRSRNVRLCAR